MCDLETIDTPSIRRFIRSEVPLVNIWLLIIRDKVRDSGNTYMILKQTISVKIPIIPGTCEFVKFPLNQVFLRRTHRECVRV